MPSEGPQKYQDLKMQHNDIACTILWEYNNLIWNEFSSVFPFRFYSIHLKTSCLVFYQRNQTIGKKRRRKANLKQQSETFQISIKSLFKANCTQVQHFMWTSAHSLIYGHHFINLCSSPCCNYKKLQEIYLEHEITRNQDCLSQLQHDRDETNICCSF